jgi:hypothetical protein
VTNIGFEPRSQHKKQRPHHYATSTNVDCVHLNIFLIHNVSIDIKSGRLPHPPPSLHLPQRLLLFFTRPLLLTRLGISSSPPCRSPRSSASHPRRALRRAVGSALIALTWPVAKIVTRWAASAGRASLPLPPTGAPPTGAPPTGAPPTGSTSSWLRPPLAGGPLCRPPRG